MSEASMEKHCARRFAWSAPSALYLILALVIAGSFWIVPFLVAPNKTADGLVLFREGGDTDYLPQVQWNAHLKLGESAVKEYAGTGVRSFPFLPTAVHALFFRVAGSTGFILADLFMIVLYACVLRQFLLMAEVGRTAAELLSLAVISSTAAWFNSALAAVTHRGLPVLFWEIRFPRPSVTESIFLVFLILSTVLMTRRQQPIWLFALYGVSYAAVLQSDIFAAFDASYVALALAVFLVLASGDRVATVKRLACAVAAIGVASLPFVYQQLHTSADLKRRWGMFPTRAYANLLPDLPVIVFACVCVLAGVALMVLYRRRDTKRGRLAVLAVVTTAIAASIVSGPVSAAILHKTIQPYHFKMATMLLIGYALLVFIGWLFTDIREMFTLQTVSQQRWAMTTAIAKAAFIAFCIFTAYSSSLERASGDIPTAQAMKDNLKLEHYRTDFRELHSVLERPEYKDATVLGTFDRELANWWLYRGHYLYTVETFNSTLPDSVMESRAFQFLRLMGTSEEDFGHLLDMNYFLIQIMGADKYLAFSYYTAWPLSDYSADERRRIAATSWPHHLELPLSEKARLMKAYEETSETPQTANALDIVVLDKDALRGYVHPEGGGRFRLAWSNRTFELWVPNKPG